MQLPEVKSYRQRLIRAGFTDVSIYDNYKGTYPVYCTALNVTKIVECSVTITQMNATPRLLYFPKYDI